LAALLPVPALDSFAFDQPDVFEDGEPEFPTSLDNTVSLQNQIQPSLQAGHSGDKSLENELTVSSEVN